MQGCMFCDGVGINPNGQVLWRNDLLRVLLVGDADYPAWCRVVLNTHTREMTDLSEAEQLFTLRTVMIVERALRDLLKPDKMNLASFGNQVPHVHWHLTPRFVGDKHFPNPTWGPIEHPNATPHAWQASNTQRLQAQISLALDALTSIS